MCLVSGERMKEVVQQVDSFRCVVTTLYRHTTVGSIVEYTVRFR